MNELVRPPMTLTVNLHVLLPDGRWRADSPDLAGFCVYGDSMPEVKLNASKALEPWLGQHVTLEFREVMDDYPG